MTICELWATCPFYETVTKADCSVGVLNEYLQIYCFGPMQNYCQRKRHHELHGSSLGANISPSGLEFKLNN